MIVNVVVISIDEIWLKGLNRSQYLKMLKRNVQNLFKKITTCEKTMIWEGPKLVIEISHNFSELELVKIGRIPGVSSVSQAIKVEASLEAASAVLLDKFGDWMKRGGSFCVRAKRSAKSFPITSPEMGRILGAMILSQHPNLSVKLDNPDKTFYVRVTHTGCFVSIMQIKGVGGLPVGTSGRALCLLSGGFDSPVASYMMSCRGLIQDFVFFYSYPLVGPEVKEKIIELANVLVDYQGTTKLHIVSFGEVQKQIAKYCEPSYKTILFRKAMVEFSNLLAKKLKAKTLIAGDALSQVSSQTLENISMIDKYSDIPIFRPLIGFNKIDIINLSKKIGTHDISCRPYDDACELFSPKHPVIRAKDENVRAFDASVNLESMYLEALEKMEIVAIS